MNKEIEVTEIRLMSPGKPLKAFIDVRIGDFLIRDFRIVQEAGKRPHVKAPFTTYKNPKGQLNFRPIIILPDEVRGEVDLTLLNAFQREMEKRNSDQSLNR